MRRSLLLLPALFLLALPAAAGPGMRARALRQRILDLEAQNTRLSSRLDAVERVLAYVHVEQGEVNDLAGPHWILEGVNVHVRSGGGFTEETGCQGPCPEFTGLGNLIVGYNETPDGYDEWQGGGAIARGGVHNLVVGPRHAYASFGGLVAGLENAVSGPYASASGGTENTASGWAASVSGGTENTAGGFQCAVNGGRSNLAHGFQTTVSGGASNEAFGEQGAVVSGGTFNLADGTHATVSGGRDNHAGGFGATVGGGWGVTATNLSWNAALCADGAPIGDDDPFFGSCVDPCTFLPCPPL